MLARPASADDKTFSLDHQVPAGCPEKAVFLANLQARSSAIRYAQSGETPDVSLWARISRGKDGVYRGRLTVTAGLQETQRELEERSCAEVSSALSLVAALALDPLAKTGGLPPLPLPPEPFVYKEVGTRSAFILPGIAVPEPQPAGMHSGWPDEVLLAPPALPVDLTYAPVPDPKLQLTATLGFAFEAGQAPTPLVGLVGAVGTEQLAELSYSFRAGLSFVTTTEASLAAVQDSEMDMRSLRGHFTACIPAYRPTSWFALWPCGEVSGGGHWAVVRRRIFGVETEREEVSPWFSIGAHPRVDLAASSWLRFELQAGPDLAVVRGRFRDDRGLLLFDPSPVVLSSALGLSASF